MVVAFFFQVRELREKRIQLRGFQLGHRKRKIINSCLAKGLKLMDVGMRTWRWLMMVVKLKLLAEPRRSQRWFCELGVEHLMPDHVAFIWLHDKQCFGDVVDIEMVGNVRCLLG